MFRTYPGEDRIALKTRYRCRVCPWHGLSHGHNAAVEFEQDGGPLRRAIGLIGLSAKPMFGIRASAIYVLLLTPSGAGGRMTPALNCAP